MKGLRFLGRYEAPPLLSYTLPVLSVAVVLIFARWLDIGLQSAPVSLLLCAVMLSAWFGGVGPGLLAIVLAVVAFAYYFVAPIYSLTVTREELPRLVSFVVAALVVGSLSAAQRSATAALRRAEEARRKTEAELAHVTRVMTMGELAASIAHEIKQPLAGVVINANACLRWLAGESPNLEEAREAAQRIIRDGTRASDIISRVRALARKTVTATERVDMNEAIREVLTLGQGEARKNKVALRTELAADVPPVRGDRVQLQQVVLNLIMNGIEAMSTVPDRPRELVVRTQTARGEPGEVRVTVQDSGIGLDPGTLEQIFDAFYTTKPAGMGMGLSISRSIVENHAGRLSVVPRDGPGATFEVTLPAYR